MEHFVFQRVDVAEEDQFKLLIMAGVSFCPLERTVNYKVVSMDVLSDMKRWNELEVYHGIRVIRLKKVQTGIGLVEVYSLRYHRTEQMIVPLGIIDREQGCLIPAEFTSEDHPLAFVKDKPPFFKLSYYIVKDKVCHVVTEKVAALSHYHNSDHGDSFPRESLYGMQLFSENFNRYEELKAKANPTFFTKYQTLLYGNNEFHERNNTLYVHMVDIPGKTEMFPSPCQKAVSWRDRKPQWEEVDQARQLYLDESSPQRLLIGKKIAHAGKVYFRVMPVNADAYIRSKAKPQGLRHYDEQLTMAFQDEYKSQAPDPKDALKAMKRYGKAKITTAFAIKRSCERGVTTFKETHGIEEDEVTLATLNKVAIQDAKTQDKLGGDPYFLKIVGAACSRYLSFSNPLFKKMQESVRTGFLPEDPSDKSLKNCIECVCQSYFIDAEVFDLTPYQDKEATPGCYAISLTPAKGQSKFKLEFTLILV
jgi:hypothetical protein